MDININIIVGKLMLIHANGYNTFINNKSLFNNLIDVFRINNTILHIYVFTKYLNIILNRKP